MNFEELHEVRYLFPWEVDHFLSNSGFELLKICRFPVIEELPSENTWNVAVVACNLILNYFHPQTCLLQQITGRVAHET